MTRPVAPERPRRSPFFTRCPVLHVDPGEVHVDREQAAAVVDEDALPGEEVVGGEDDEALLGRQDGRPGRCAVVGPAVRRARLAVEDPPLAEVPRRRGVLERGAEGEGEDGIRPEGEERNDDFPLPVRPTAVLLRQVDLPRVDLELLLGVGRGEDPDRRRLAASRPLAEDLERSVLLREVDRVVAGPVEGLPTSRGRRRSA